jgi:hypothetical protein
MASQPEKLGAVKLQKILWYFEARSYVLTGSPAVGATFVKGHYGPFTREIEPVVRELVAARRLYAGSTEFYDNEKAVFIGKGETDRSVFSDRELRWLEEITLDICESHTAASISEKSHGPIWRMASLGEEIPIEAVAIRIKPASPAATEAAKHDLEIA